MALAIDRGEINISLNGIDDENVEEAPVADDSIVIENKISYPGHNSST